MKLNRRRGATLGLVAFAVLVIIVLGVGFFILSQILGGGREVANATDAGVLNVARKALSPTLIKASLGTSAINNGTDSVNNPTADFLGVGTDNDGNANTSTGSNDGSCNNISMLSLNRIIAQSVIVACNAEELNTATASQHAHAVANAARQIATGLKALVEGSTLSNNFNAVATQNNTKMFQGNKVNLNGLQSAFMRQGFSTNVYITNGLEEAVQVSLPSNLKNSNGSALTHDIARNERYMAGYVDFSVPAGPNGAINIAGVPIFPKQKPHLVQPGEFNLAANAPGSAYLPPNSFRANTETRENNTQGFGGAVACALVGALDQDFAASIPRGYVRIRNGIDARQDPDHANLLTQPVIDGATDIFNNELWGPTGGAFVSNNDVYALNSNPAARDNMFDWMNYNAERATNPTTAVRPRNGAGFSDGLPTGDFGGSTGVTVSNAALVPGVNKIIPGPAGYTAATVNDMANISNIPPKCTAQFGWREERGMSDPCRFGNGDPNASQNTLLYSLLQQTLAQMPQPGDPQGAPTAGGYTAVEVQKYDLLSRRFGTGRCARVEPVIGSPKPYGMKKFNTSGGYCTPGVDVAFGEPGSPLELIHQIGATSGDPTSLSTCQDHILVKIHDRIRQADPQITMAQVISALGSSTLKLDLGESLYLYSPGPNTVALVQGSASTTYFRDADAVPSDGAGSPRAGVLHKCENTYDIANNIVNAHQGRPGGSGCGATGDAGFHEAPYTRGPDTGSLPAVDRAEWTPSSGFRNLLGDLHFQNEAKGAGEFCKPN